MDVHFTNVQVHTDNRPASEVKDHVISVIRKWLSAKALIEVGNDEMADRTVLVGRSENEPWITVYDEATEEQDIGKLDELARVLSEGTGSATVGVLANDSCIVYLRLFREGRPVDTYCSSPEDLDQTVLPPELQPCSGNPTAWWALLVGGATSADLRAAWDSCALADRIVVHTAQLVGWDPQLCTTGFNCVDDLDRSDHFIELSFRLREQR